MLSALAARLGMADAEFHRWLGRRLRPALPSESPNPGTRYALWEDPADPNFSSYSKGARYPVLHPAATSAVVSRYRRIRSDEQAEIGFITAIAGRYDTPKWHEHLLPNADYLLFSDVLQSHPLHDVRPFPYFNVDPTRMARFIKTHPHSFAPDYKVVIWVDGNMVIRGDLGEEIETFIQSGCPIGAIPHPLRSSIYDEGEACTKRAKDEPELIDRQLDRYRRQGFESQFLIESGFMMYRLDHPQLPGLLSRWWGEIERGSRRDQLSLPFVIEQSGAEWHRITELGTSVRNHPKLVLVPHEPFQDPICPDARDVDRAPAQFRLVKESRIAAQAGRRMDIVVCVHNALDCVKRCLTSVAATRNATCHRIIIVNDGSGSETSDWLHEFARENENCQLIEHVTALGYTKAANVGMGASDGEALVLLNSDTEVAPNWIEKLFDAFDAVPGIGIVGPISNAASHQSVPDHRSHAGNTAINPFPEGYGLAQMDQWCEEQATEPAFTLVPLVHGFCFAIRREVRESIGKFDEQAFPFGYGEENDFCLRASNAGFLLAVALHTFVFHEKSQSFENEKRIALMQNGAAKLREIHGKERIVNAVRSMQENPAFVRLRQLSTALPYTRDVVNDA
ncbi:glycosyltransferase [Sphingomonas sp. NSE70-1]|uniref:Glycosyltransferase n=1 Tax=Sphingomonas caseinilyticus TaxID=2908205 RepID=A0ABT0RWP3_9SPHN|nr:glycosyltransferase [Sphingomonas caseinilyticus]MCL6699248.1 glycosyltransferase [Sphingomonas caseinilyticus]